MEGCWRVELIGEDRDEMGAPDRDPGGHRGQIAPDHCLCARLLKHMLIKPRHHPAAKDTKQRRQQHESEVVIMMNTVGDPEHLNPIKY